MLETGQTTAIGVSARERILDAAYELFSRRGIRAVGINEVIERAVRLFDEVALAPSTPLRHAAMKRAQWEIDRLAELGDPVLFPDEPPDNAPRH